MQDASTAVTARRKRWWGAFALALFLLVPVDLATTLLSVAEHGLAVEANPIMRVLLHHGLLATTVANLLAVALAVTAFHLAVDAVEDAPSAYRRVLERGVDAWLGVVVLGGVLLIANNVRVLL